MRAPPARAPLEIGENARVVWAAVVRMHDTTHGVNTY